MSQLQQYYFSVEKLQELIKHFDKKRIKASDGKTHLKGFIFTPGVTPEGKESVFAFPLYSGTGNKGGSDGDIIIQNMTFAYGCPYPPPCDTTTSSMKLKGKGKGKEDGCYDETK